MLLGSNATDGTNISYNEPSLPGLSRCDGGGSDEYYDYDGLGGLHFLLSLWVVEGMCFVLGLGLVLVSRRGCVYVWEGTWKVREEILRGS